MQGSSIVGVLIPDKASGEAFCETFFANSSREVKRYYVQIRPRVIGNRMNDDAGVARDLAAALESVAGDGTELVMIACNTLQLWLSPALEQLPKRVRDKLTVLTSIDAILWKYGKDPDLVWLGTSVLMQRLTELGFVTLIRKGLPELQHLLQEIIWRVKAVNGMDHQTAGAIERIDDAQILEEKVRLLVSELVDHDIHRAVMGCTELPLVMESVLHENLEVVNPAVVLAEYVEHVLAVPVAEL